MVEREMTGIEALEELTHMINREKHINSSWNAKIKNLKELVLKSLNRQEQLEKVNQELKARYKRRAKISNDLCQVVKQYEKAFELLVDLFKLEIKDNKLHFLYNNSYFELDKEQEESLNEVLGNGKEK